MATYAAIFSNNLVETILPEPPPPLCTYTALVALVLSLFEACSSNKVPFD